jgi:hypothetical protein
MKSFTEATVRQDIIAILLSLPRHELRIRDSAKRDAIDHERFKIKTQYDPKTMETILYLEEKQEKRKP